MKHQKILLGIGTLTMAFAPVAVMVSCGSSFKEVKATSDPKDHNNEYDIHNKSDMSSLFHSLIGQDKGLSRVSGSRKVAFSPGTIIVLINKDENNNQRLEITVTQKLLDDMHGIDKHNPQLIEDTVGYLIQRADNAASNWQTILIDALKALIRSEGKADKHHI